MCGSKDSHRFHGEGFGEFCLKKIQIGIVALLFALVPLALPVESDDEPKADAYLVMCKYLEAAKSPQNSLRGASMQVDIDASVPKLKKQGTMHALRKISKVGEVTYKLLGYNGDNTIKKDVIARYLSAEQQAQGKDSLSITPDHYKFKYKGLQEKNGMRVHVFQLSPRKKEVGLFKGELWLDGTTCLPVQEKGRFVKNPSIFFKKVEFVRNYAIRDGVAIPQRMESTIDARFIGKVQLNINYSAFSHDETDERATTNLTNVAYR